MAFSLTQQQGTVSSATANNTQTLTSVVAGSTLVVMVANRSNTTLPTGISDTVNGAWTLSNGNGLGANGVSSGIYFFPNSGAGSPVITVTYSGAVTNLMASQEWGVTSSAVTLETSNSTTNSATTSHSHGSITTAGAGLVLTASVQASALTETVSSGFTALTDNGLRMWMQYEVRASGYTTTGTYTTSVNGDTVGTIIALIEPSGSSVTKTPAQAVLTVNLLAPSTNAFTYVAIQDTLISESGQAVANAANIRLMVWYSGQAVGAPDYSVNGQTSNASGSISWSVAPGTLTNGQAIFYLAQDSISYSNYTCGRVVPTYG